MEKLKQVIKKSISEKIFSGIGVEVNHKGKNVLSLYDGKTFFEEKETGKEKRIGKDKGNEQTPSLVTPKHLFDLASLTKPLCTSLLTSILVDKGCMNFNTPISEILNEFSLSYNKEFDDIKMEDLLNHSSGLDAWIEIYGAVSNRSDAYMFVRSRPLSYVPGSKHMYSDLGYILLGELVEIILDHKLDYLFDHFVAQPLELHDLCYVPLTATTTKKEKSFVASGYSQIRNRLLVGEVNDENAYVFNGIAGHAGLFGTASNVCSLGQHILDIIQGKAKYPVIGKNTLSKVLARSSDNSEWAYGWHYPTEQNSTAGKNISKNSVGMTGFTGTSIWIDFDNSLVITILANRTIASDAAKFGGTQDRFSALRPLMHDIIIGELI
ncbi:MAG: serine hydrolase [Proteobacteria bacterium]|nr:serine hydrolase [Pseudomonadota bacterium]